MLCEVNPSELLRLAAIVRYVGSSEHKSYPSFAGPPKLRSDATRCDPDFRDKLDLINDWLREAVRRGWIGAPMENGFPRYIWYKNESGSFYEARLVNSGSGEYKAWALHPDEDRPAI